MDRRRRQLSRKYRKHHIPQVKGFWEKYYFRPGNAGWPVFDTSVGKVASSSATTATFPEGWRQVGLAGASWSTTVGHLRAVRLPLAAGAARRGRRQRVFIAAINRVGQEELRRATTSTAPATSSTRADSSSARPSDKQEELVVRDLDFGLIDEVRQQWPLPRPAARRLRGWSSRETTCTGGTARLIPTGSCSTTAAVESPTGRAGTSGRGRQPLLLTSSAAS
ncbi:nitrilase-related carbon-nitrogen hydrolase [Streptomyces spongiicola]|uniref:nitrilase-related carbon-nitrogen hydrolase n=1 Tax=Streptomyces spongiicola TaxID=1690221 RepID=UPI0013A5B446